MKLKTETLGVVVLLAATGSALADWDVTDPYKMHYPQLPDLNQGMNVLATERTVLADDFLCTASGPITDIHIWGSWLDVMALKQDQDPTVLFGWKTSADHWNDDSVYAFDTPGLPPAWAELIDPDFGFSLDQAFVITPEPMTLSMIGLGGLAVLTRRRRRTSDV